MRFMVLVKANKDSEAGVLPEVIDEAIEWVKRSPNPFPGVESEIEIRQVYEADDFGAEFTPELREQEERIGKQMAANASR